MVEVNGFVVRENRYGNIPAGDNPFLHDYSNMGTSAFREWMVMALDHTHNGQITLVHIPTGRRIVIEAPTEPSGVSGQRQDYLGGGGR